MTKSQSKRPTKIISRFYVIYGDDKPIYVGYTNRSLKVRLAEHKKQKDFSSYQVIKIKQIDTLSYDFTWDMNIIESYANQVAQHEGELIQKYQTQNSIYQKADHGGQTWANIKGFIITNKNNPKYQKMNQSEILQAIDLHRYRKYQLSKFLVQIDDKNKFKIKMFIYHLDKPNQQKLANFIRILDDPNQRKLANFIGNINSHNQRQIFNFVNKITQSENKRKIKAFVTNFRTQNEKHLKNFINNLH